MNSRGHRVRPTSARPGAATLDDLKGRILAAQRARTLINDPAVYRLDFILRLLATLTILVVLSDAVYDAQLPAIRQSHEASRAGFAASTVALCMRQALDLFLACVFWRCIKHIQRNEARALISTMPVIGRVYMSIIATTVVALPLRLAQTHTRAESMTAVWSTSAGIIVLALLIVVVRRHARNAEPVLAMHARNELRTEDPG